MKQKNLKISIIALALAGCFAIGAISAYFTDADAAVNTFTVGKVEIDLQEPKWIPPTFITPEQEFEKDPQVKNTGINDAYIFVEVIVPYANVYTANKDGTRNEKADTELFTYDVKNGWVELGTGTKDTDNGTITHLYAYGTADAMAAVESGATTDSVFDYIKFVNLVEDKALDGAALDVVIHAYAIQTANLNDGKEHLDGDNTDGKATPEEVWSVLFAQNGDNPDYSKEGEDANTDIVM